MTKQECAIIMAYTGIAMLSGNDLKIFYDYVDKITNNKYGYDLGVYIHSDEIKSAATSDFIELCQNAKDELENYNND